jgi:hypothetical protein
MERGMGTPLKMLAELKLKIPPPKRNDNAWSNCVANSATEQREDSLKRIAV